MGYKKKSWREKLNDDKDLPKVVKIEGKLTNRWGKGTCVILAPREVDAIMKSVPKGKLITMADKRFYGRIIGHGNKYLRWAFIEAVWPAIKKDLSLRELYESLKLRKGANKAKVAVARRLTLIAYRVLSQRNPYAVNYSGCPHVFLAKAIK